MFRNKLSMPSRTRQTGASLVISLIMLAMLMLIGISAMVVSTDQFKMAGNMQFQQLAQNNAESALAEGENWVSTNFSNAGFATRTAGGLYPFGGTSPVPNTMVWDNTTSISLNAAGSQRYMIEKIVDGRVLPSNSVSSCNLYGLAAPCPKVNVYRITARGTSILGAAQMVESVFAVRVNIT